MSGIILNDKEKIASSRLCLALNVPLKQALVLIPELADLVGMYKIGFELFYSAGLQEHHTDGMILGRNIVAELNRTGARAFIDGKFEDTPETVEGAARAVTMPGVYMFNLHIAGGEVMCKKAIEASTAEATKKGIPRPYVIGVTVLTSLKDNDLSEQGLGITYKDLVRRRTELAIKWGLDGIVCPANIAGALEQEYGTKLLKVTPGIEWSGLHGEGQQQLYTPDRAVQESTNSILVTGSAILKAGNEYQTIEGKKKLVREGTPEDRRNRTYEMLQAMAQHL